jgi:transcriptional regulator with XRE-family HTH domain
MARLRLRMSQESLGKAIGLDQQYISKLERGTVTEITVTTLARLADVLGMSMDYLAGRTSKEDASLFEPADGALVPA